MNDNKELQTRCFECEFGQAREDYATVIVPERKRITELVQQFDEPVVNELLALYDFCCVPDCMLDCISPCDCKFNKLFEDLVWHIDTPYYCSERHLELPF